MLVHQWIVSVTQKHAQTPLHAISRRSTSIPGRRRRSTYVGSRRAVDETKNREILRGPVSGLIRGAVTLLTTGNLCRQAGYSKCRMPVRHVQEICRDMRGNLLIGRCRLLQIFGPGRLLYTCLLSVVPRKAKGLS